MTVFSELLEKLRRERGLRKGELAARAGISNAYMSQLTLGDKQAPSAATVAALVKALQLDDIGAQTLFDVAGLDRVHQQTSSSEALAQVNWADAPAVDEFCGRAEELKLLERWVLADACRLVSVLGMGGIGKTALCVVFAKHIAPRFNHVVWRSLINAPPFPDLAADIIEHLGGPARREIPQNLDGQLATLIACLRQRRCLVVLDNVESLLDDTQNFGADNQAYGQLLRRVGETSHKSCVLLTSREKPSEVSLRESSPSAIRTMVLTGLAERETREMLRARGLEGSRSDWAAFNSVYSGNPLALKMIAGAIQELFGGDIVRFLATGTGVFGDVRRLLDQHFSGLDAHQRTVLYWLAIEREAVSLALLNELIVDSASAADRVEALCKLQRRSLVEQDDGRFSLQNVILEYITDKIVNKVCDEITNQNPDLLHTHALSRAQAQDYVRESQMRLILRLVVQRLRQSMGQARLRDAIEQLLEKGREQDFASGYVGSNALHLLVQLGDRLNDLDFSHTSMKQAHFAGVELHNCNLAHADLSGSVFTDALTRASTVAIGSDDELIAAGALDGRVHLWWLSDGQQAGLWTAHRGPVWSVQFSPDGLTMASCGDDQVIRFWDAREHRCLRQLEGHRGPVRSLAFNRDGRLLASASEDQTVKLWSVADGKLCCTLRGHRDTVFVVALSDRTKLIASGGADGKVRLWRLGTGRHIRTLAGHTSWVWSISFNADATLLATGSDDRTLRIWDVETGRCLRTLPDHQGNVKAVAFAPQGDLLASAEDGGAIRVWDSNSGRRQLVIEGHESRLWSIAFSRGGELLVASDDRSVKLWEISSGRCLRTLRGYINRIWSVDFVTHDETVLFGASDDGMVRRWRPSDCRCSHVGRGHSGTVLSTKRRGLLRRGDLQRPPDRIPVSHSP